MSKLVWIAVVAAGGMMTPLLQAQARGIQIINLDNRIDADAARQAGLKIATFIGPDNVEGARKSAAAMIEKIDSLGNPVSSASREVAMLEGIRGVSNAEARKRGFQQAILHDIDEGLDDSRGPFAPTLNTGEIGNGHLPCLKWCAEDIGRGYSVHDGIVNAIATGR